jgi:Zn-dependent protease with chaperone function
MKSKGAEIRILKLPKEEVSDFVRKFIESKKLEIEKDENLSSELTNIRASNQIDSYVKFWWRGSPQLIDWKIFELKNNETKIETRFGYQKKYWLWFWCVLIMLCIHATILFEPPIRVHPLSNARLFSYILFILLLLAATVFAQKGGEYEPFLEKFSRFMEKNCEDYSETLIKSNCKSPHSYELMFFAGAVFLIFALIKFTEFASLFVENLAIAAPSFFFLLTFLALYCFSVRNPHRLAFVIVSFIVTFPFIIFYGIPHFHNQVGSGIAKRYSQYLEFEVIAKKHPENKVAQKVMTEHRETLWRRSFTIAITNLAFIGLAVTVVVHAPGQAMRVKSWKKGFFSGRKWSPLHRKVIEHTGNSIGFYCTVLICWIGISIVIYILSFTTLSIFEHSIFGSNILFSSNIGEALFKDNIAFVSLLFMPLMSQQASNLLARLIIIIYCMPLLYMMYKLFEKRIKTYFRDVKERRQFLLSDKNDRLNLKEIVKEISEELGVHEPDLVVVPVKLPMMTAKYVGLPYFRSYVWLSEGCLKLKREELAGLLAHEIYHIKRHLFRWHVLRLLSDYTLFGSGFLAIAANSYQFELEADDRAARWVKERGWISEFIDALKVMDASKPDVEEQGLYIACSPITISNEVQKDKSFFKRLKRNINGLIELYFGETILSYVHPPLGERIERIKAIAQSEADL